jgi:methanogenic corrinoid protein MtbC1
MIREGKTESMRRGGRGSVSDRETFAARILEMSASGYAGLATSLLVERDPDIARRYDPDGFSKWKAQLQRWLVDLSAAVESGEPKLFEAGILWTRQAFTARGATPEDLRAALAALRDILRERMPAGSAEEAIPAVDLAIQSLGDTPVEAPGGGAEEEDLAAGPALAYLEAVLDGRPREAIDQVLAEVPEGRAVRDVYLEVLLPALREAGRMWHAGAMSIAEEHLVTATTQRAMALLCERARPSSRNGRTAVLACVSGNVHDIGIRAIADFLEMAGWRAIYLGQDVPAEEIAACAQVFGADVVVLAATLDPHVKAVRLAIELIRDLEKPDVKVIVGGHAFEKVPDLWRKVGADAHAARVEEAGPLASQLVA